MSNLKPITRLLLGRAKVNKSFSKEQRKGIAARQRVAKSQIGNRELALRYSGFKRANQWIHGNKAGR